MDSLVSTQWLADQLGAADLVVLDASMHLPDSPRQAAQDFAAAHVPGARFLDLGFRPFRPDAAWQDRARARITEALS